MWVCDTGFASEENRADPQRAGGHYILGESCARGPRTAPRSRARAATQGRGGLVKQMWVGEGETRRRFVVCRNLDEARRDRLRRERALERLAEELEAVERRHGEARVQAEAELLTHPTSAAT